MKKIGQNTSSAVMQQRTEPHDSLDFFPTPPWATRALCAHVAPITGHLAWDPACGDGAMDRPPAVVAQFVERVPMVKGRLDAKASTATSYCWLVWTNRAHGWEQPDWAPKGGHSAFMWIPPCRKSLERPDDYPQDVG